MGETWKKIKENNKYEISSFGHVRYNYNGKIRLLTPWNVRGNYKAIDTKKDGKRKVLYVHRLVAEAFIPNPDNKPCINHIDNDPSNNRVENLEWCTHAENTSWMMSQGRGTPQKRVMATNIETGERLFFDSIQETKKFGFLPSCVCNCCKGMKSKEVHAYSHKGYKWEYAE